MHPRVKPFVSSCLLLAALCALALSGCQSSGNPGPGRVLTTVTVTPALNSVQTAATQQFTVAALDQSGVAFAAIDITVTWATVNPAGGSIDAAGLFTAGTVGVYPGLVTATVTHIGTTEILADTADVTVTP